jgi:hypothetical protein
MPEVWRLKPGPGDFAGTLWHQGGGGRSISSAFGRIADASPDQGRSDGVEEHRHSCACRCDDERTARLDCIECMLSEGVDGIGGAAQLREVPAAMSSSSFDSTAHAHPLLNLIPEAAVEGYDVLVRRSNLQIDLGTSQVPESLLGGAHQLGGEAPSPMLW